MFTFHLGCTLQATGRTQIVRTGSMRIFKLEMTKTNNYKLDKVGLIAPWANGQLPFS